MLLEVEQEGYAKSLIVTEAGLVGGKGLNEYGVALSMNAMSVNGGKVGVPLQVVLRAALSCSTVPKAIDCIAKCPRAGCACVGLASWDGELVMVEYAPNDLDILLSDGKALCHTNHWQSLKMILGPEARNYSYISTFTRLDRARRLTKDKKKLTPKKLFAILSDHAGYPDGICRHDDPDLPYYHCHSAMISRCTKFKTIRGSCMNKRLLFLPIVLCAFSASANAGQYAEELGVCVYKNLTSSDKTVMTQWAFVTLGKTKAARQKGCALPHHDAELRERSDQSRPA